MFKTKSIFLSIFNDDGMIKKIQKYLSPMFQQVEIENSRNGKIGMEVGSHREKILISMLMYKFGINNVDANIPITKPEIDVYVNGHPLSIKTITTVNKITNFKLIWTVDHKKAEDFKQKYKPSCDILLVQINWNSIGHMYLFPIEAQKDVYSHMNKDKYIKIPKEGTNSRGVEITKEALFALSIHPLTKKIDINFSKSKINSSVVYKRWIEWWKK